MLLPLYVFSNDKYVFIVGRAVQVEKANWSIGPDTLEALFDWAHHNSLVFLKQSSDAKKFIANIADVMAYDFEINDAYSGLGTGGYTFHLQHTKLRRTLVGIMYCFNGCPFQQSCVLSICHVF